MFGKLPARSLMSLYVVSWHARRYFKDCSRCLSAIGESWSRTLTCHRVAVEGDATSWPQCRYQCFDDSVSVCLGAGPSALSWQGEETRLFRLGKGVTHPSCCKCDILWCHVKSLSPLFPFVVGLNPYQFRPDRWISLGLWSSLIRPSAQDAVGKMLEVWQEKSFE